MSKWFTCAPVRFEASEGFFWRDSGLISRGLQELGHESQVILQGPAFEGDLPGILRASREELESADWWRALKLDGVIMVAWGRHIDTPIAKAIAASGTPFVLHLDGGGNPFPLYRKRETIKTLWRCERDTQRSWGIRSLTFLKAVVTTAIRLAVRHSYLKYKHLQYATVVTHQTPTALEGHHLLCSFYGGKNHGVNLQLVGCPIPDTCAWNPSISKKKQIIAIGRWDDLQQKRPYVLMAACEGIARIHLDLQIEIFGTKTDALACWHSALPPDLQARIHVRGYQPAETVALSLQTSQITFVPSSTEGGPLALFEGLACGATTVGLDTPDLPGTRFAADYHHADFASEDTIDAFVAALDQGLKKWERGEYSPQQISECWSSKTHATKIAQAMLDAAAKASQPRGPRQT